MLQTMPRFTSVMPACNARVSERRAACGRRCGRATSALKNQIFDSTRHQIDQGLNAFERQWSDLPLLQNDLPLVKAGADLFNGDNDLRAFFRFAPRFF